MEQGDLQHSAWHSHPRIRFWDNWNNVLLPQVIGGAAEERDFTTGVDRNRNEVSDGFRGSWGGQVFPQMPLLLEQM